MIEQRLAVGRHLRRPLEQGGEVHDVPAVDHVLEDLPVEPREFLPAAQPGLLGSLKDVLGCEQGFLRPGKELANLVGERAHAQHVSVRRPLSGVPVHSKQFLHQGELVTGGEQVRWLRIVEPTEPGVQDVASQAVDRDHAELRSDPWNRASNASRASSRALRDPTTNATRSPGVGPALQELGEPLAENRGLPGPGASRDQHGARPVRQDARLLRGRGRGDVIRRMLLRDTDRFLAGFWQVFGRSLNRVPQVTNGGLRDRDVAAARRTPWASSAPRSRGDTTLRHRADPAFPRAFRHRPPGRPSRPATRTHHRASHRRSRTVVWFSGIKASLTGRSGSRRPVAGRSASRSSR